MLDIIYFIARVTSRMNMHIFGILWWDLSRSTERRPIESGGQPFHSRENSLFPYATSYVVRISYVKIIVGIDASPFKTMKYIIL